MGKSLKLFLMLFFTYAFFTNAYLTTNDASRFSMAVAIVDTHGLEITDILPRVLPYHEGQEGWQPRDFVKIDGRYYSDKAPLGAILGAPVYFIVSRLTHRLPVIIFFVSLFTSGLLTAFTGVLLYKTGRFFKCGELQSLLIAIVYGLGSMSLFYGQIFFSSGITVFFLFASFYLLASCRAGKGTANAQTLAGICAALSVMSDYYAGLAALVLLAYSWTSWRAFARTSAAFALTMLVLFAYNFNLYGNPLETGYHYSYLSASLHSKGFYGITLPSAEGLARLKNTMLAKWGFFFTNLPVLFSIVYFPRFARYRREAAAVAAIFAGYIFMNISVGWEDAYSARFFMPALPFLFLPLFTLPLRNRYLRDTFFFIAGLSLMLNFIGVDHFMPKVKTLAWPGMQNLFGEWLAAHGYGAGYYTFIPLFVIYLLIWVLLPSKKPAERPSAPLPH